MTEWFIYELPLWALAILIVLVLIAALETGSLLGRRAEQDKGQFGQLTTLQAAVLGLLALVLAFTYSFVSSRLEARKSAVLAEANAIGTAYLRADFAPPPQRDHLQRLLAEYARTRLVTYQSAGTLEKVNAAVARSLAVQKQLWPVVDEVMENTPGGPKEALLAQAVNDVIDLHTARLTAGLDKLPAIVFIMLLVVGGLAMLITGYNAGVKGKMNRWISMSFAGVLAFIIFIIADLDNPLRGFVHVSQQPLADLVKSLEAHRPTDPVSHTRWSFAFRVSGLESAWAQLRARHVQPSQRDLGASHWNRTPAFHAGVRSGRACGTQVAVSSFGFPASSPAMPVALSFFTRLRVGLGLAQPGRPVFKSWHSHDAQA